MHNIIIDKPYQFVPPRTGTWFPSLIQRFNLHGWYLRRWEGVESYELRGADRLRESLQRGYGILLTPNHCRYADPMALGWLARDTGCHLFAMASWHLFNQHWFSAWAIRALGAFSVNREGVDRQAINTAIQILETGDRPLVIFPEGAISRTNDHLHALLDGVAFIARSAAKKRAKRQSPAGVVIHPVAIKYLFRGDLDAVAAEVLQEIEHRFSWRPQTHLSTYQRVGKLVRGLLSLKEVEFFGAPQKGSNHDRWQRLIDRLLRPIEEEWLGGAQVGPVVPRVKALRIKILPEMVQNLVSESEHRRRWGQLADMYLAQQVSCYPPDYLVTRPSVDRVLETMERLEEDLTDRVRVHGQLHVVIQVGEAIEVSTHRERGAAVDPLMVQIESRLQTMLDQLALESPLVPLADGGLSEPPVHPPVAV